MTPAGQAILDARKDGKLSGTEPDANCLPQGIPKIEQTPLPFKIIQQPNLVVVLYEAFGQYRQFFLDGRPLPKDPNPQWYGYSVAHWDGDVLVVESSGMNGKVWLDQAGHPSSEQMRTTERFHRIDFGHLQVQTTIDDPVIGPVRQQAPFPRLANSPAPVPRGAPLLGEHNREVWCDLVGLSDEELADLGSRGVV